jgi:hypothetical protein
LILLTGSRILLCGPRGSGHQSEDALQQAGRHFGKAGSEQSINNILKLSHRLDAILGKQVDNNQSQRETLQQAGRHLGKAESEQSINNILKFSQRLDAILGKQVNNNQVIAA